MTSMNYGTRFGSGQSIVSAKGVRHYCNGTTVFGNRCANLIPKHKEYCDNCDGLSDFPDIIAAHNGPAQSGS